MKGISKNTIDEFIRACHRVDDHGLVTSSSGNLSLRLDDERMLVTASGSWMSDISEDDVTTCLISDGSVVSGKTPTTEIGFHRGILRTRPDITTVLHFQSPRATVLSCQKQPDINYNIIPEIPFYIGSVAQIPYFHPGSEELTHAVVHAIGNHDMILMRNHGQITVARELDHVIRNAVFFEFACEIILIGKDGITLLDEKNTNKLMELKNRSSQDI